jgi:tetratricopeptide (TPR) repeat protein
MAKAASKPTSKKPVAKKTSTKAATVGAFVGDSMSIWGKISWWSLLAMIFLVPIAMSNWTWLGFKLPITYDQFDIIKVFLQRVLGTVAIMAWGWDILVNGGKIRRTPLDWLILGFLGWVTISMFTSISPATAFFGKYRRFEGLASFINYAVVYFLVLQYADRPSRVRAMAETLFWSSFIVAGYGLLQATGHDPINWGTLPFEQMRPFSTYGNPDLLGGFLMFSLPIALGLALAEENMWLRLVYWAGFGINVYVWIVSFTRGAWIGGAIGIVLMCVVAWRHTVKLSLIDWVPVGLTGALGGLAIYKSMSNPNEVMNFGARLASITKFNEGSGLTRTEIWSAAIKSITYSPLRFVFGWGADTFRLVFPKFKPVEYTRDAGYLSVADNVHDYPLQLASGIGVVGVVMLYSIFIWAAAASAKLVFGKSDDRNRIILGAFWVAAFAYLVQLMFGLSVTGNTFLLWMCVGAVMSPTAKTVDVKAPSWGLPLASALAVLAVLVVSYQFVMMAADRQYLLARVVYQGEQRTAAALKARQLNPFNDMYRAEVGLAYTDELIGVYNAIVQAQQAGQPTAPYAGMLQKKFDAAQTALLETIAFVPDEYDNYVFITNLYGIGGQLLDKKYYAEGVKWAQKGINIEPFGPAVRVQMARALVSQGEYPAALSQLETAWKMDKTYGEAATLLATEYQRVGRIKDAIEVLKTTEAMVPGQAGVAPLLQKLEASASVSSQPTSTKKP